MKRSIAYLLALVLLLCTACQGSSPTAVDTNGEGWLPLPFEKATWETTPEEALALYAGAETSQIAETTYVIAQGSDLGELYGAPVTKISFMYRSSLSYNGQAGVMGLYQVNVELDTTDFDTVAALLDGEHGTGTDGQMTIGPKYSYRYWVGKNGLRQLDAACAALALALDSQVEGEVRAVLLGSSETPPQDAAQWPGVNLTKSGDCQRVCKAIDDTLNVRNVMLAKGETQLVLTYYAAGMTFVPAATGFLKG